DVDPRVADGPSCKDEPPALDIELTRIGRVLALLDIQLTRRTGDLVITAAHGDVPRQSPGETAGIDADTIAQAQGDRADDLEALGGVCNLLAYDHFVRGRTDRTCQVRRHDPGVGNLDGSRCIDLAAVDVEFQVG